jgi:antitoxin component of RelBE/YafQ-DinJ toxin-antitoxin module
MNIMGYQALRSLPMEMHPNVQDEAAYISENFGIPISTALELTLEKAKKATKAKKKRVGR